MAGGDRKNSKVLKDLFEIALADRTVKWPERFYSNVAGAALIIDERQAKKDSDGFPYVHLRFSRAGERVETVCIDDLLPELIREGSGVAIDSASGETLWKLSHGSLWCYAEFGKFEMKELPGPRKPVILLEPGNDQDVVVGHPEDDYFPPYVRTVISNYLKKERNIKKPKVLLLGYPSSQPFEYLVFSFFPEAGFAREADFIREYERLRWFLPGHYGLIAISKKSDLVDSFDTLDLLEDS